MPSPFVTVGDLTWVARFINSTVTFWMTPPEVSVTRPDDVALSLGIPMYGADPRLAPLGSKTGCRRMFAEAGIPHPLGVENLRTLDDMADAVVGMRAERPSMDSVIVKLNEGVSGEGNALVRLGGPAGARLPGRARRRHGAAARAWSWSR